MIKTRNKQKNYKILTQNNELKMSLRIEFKEKTITTPSYGEWYHLLGLLLSKHKYKNDGKEMRMRDGWLRQYEK